VAVTKGYTAVGAFTDRKQAQIAIEELRRAGFESDHIGIAVRDEGPAASAAAKAALGNKIEEGAGAGAAAGGALGALTGAVVTGLIPGIGPFIATGFLGAILGGTALLGAAAGSLIGALLGIGMAEEEADYYDREFSAGRLIVAVRAGSRASEAADILRRAGAYRTSASKYPPKAPGQQTSEQRAPSQHK
jgi:hypothetical protein